MKLTLSEDTGSVPNTSAHINAILFLQKKNRRRKANTALRQYLDIVSVDDASELARDTL